MKVKSMKYKESHLLMLGVVLGYLSLSMNQFIPYHFDIASLISPTGAQFIIYGFRIKHWISGAFVGIIGLMSYIQVKNTTLRQIGLVAIGFGGFLVFDEYMDVFRFITTGVYP